MYQMPNFNMGGSGLSPEQIVNRGRALIKPLPQTSNTNPLMTPELEAQLDAIKQRQATEVPNTRQSQYGNILDDSLRNLEEIGTGLVYMGQHPVRSIVAPVVESVTKAGKSGIEGSKDSLVKGAGNFASSLGKDFVNFIISNYDVTADDILDVIQGKQNAKDVAKQAFDAAIHNPVFTGLDIASMVLPALKSIKGSSKISKVAAQSAEGTAKAIETISPAERIAGEINTKGAKVGSKTNAFIDKIDTIKKNNKYEDIVKAVEAHQTGAEAPQLSKKLLKDVGEVMETYDTILDEKYKYADFLTKEEKFSIADAQATQVKSLDKTKSFQEIQRDRRPYTDLLKEESGREYLNQLASEGDTLAQDVLNNYKNFERGYLRITPQAGITDIEKVGNVIEKDRRFYGRASDRVYGTATAEQIADHYFVNPNEFMNKEMNNIIERQIVGEIATKGTLGNVPLVTEKTKKIVYINPEAGELTKVIESAKDVADEVSKVAIDKDLLKAMSNQWENKIGTNNPFAAGSGLDDLWKLNKSNMLVGGSYLVGNAQTGFVNAAMNAGLNPVKFAQNFINAWRSNGELAKQIGKYRYITPMERNIKSPVLKGVAKYSGTESISNTLNYIDSKLQNTFVEMALHENLSNKGIKFEARSKALADMDAYNLAKTIEDAETIGLLNKTKTLIPAKAGKFWSLTNPYWRWADTAAQSSAYLLAKQPVIGNMVLNKFAGNVAFDQEMQNRFNLGVQSDKPFVSYRFNPETKQLQEVSAEFMPVMNTLKLVGETARAVKEGNGSEAMNRLGLLSIPFITEVGNAIQGKDRFGRPILNAKADRNQMRIDYRTGERYEMTPQGFKRVQGGTGKEILGTTLNNLIGSNKFFNKIVGPTAAASASLLTGKNYRYYQPYQYQQFGEIQRAGQMPEWANPRRSSGVMDVVDTFTGAYARNYDPQAEAIQNGPIMPRDYINLMKGMGRRNFRTQDILRRQGGGY